MSLIQIEQTVHSSEKGLCGPQKKVTQSAVLKEHIFLFQRIRRYKRCGFRPCKIKLHAGRGDEKFTAFIAKSLHGPDKSAAH